ncbi:hypothetical protein DCAR_0624513 [Daucus carota subsp. sativus]|uniref:Uncharacterized protein n=1 Tax=Daucus carota subsp. sativus TaxID=79200 RepID=A0A164VVV5_DAUCS|nr:hypothetical protein DCAR_0624513 [Daucus carota subsp. sativus]
MQLSLQCLHPGYCYHPTTTPMTINMAHPTAWPSSKQSTRLLQYNLSTSSFIFPFRVAHLPLTTTPPPTDTIPVSHGFSYHRVPGQPTRHHRH